MKILGAVFGLLVLAVVLVFWFRAYRSIKGEDGPLFSMGNRKPKKENNSLNEFIAAYKRGEATPVPATPADGTPAPVKAVVAASTVPDPATPAKQGAFISGSTKLAYLACKTGLRDHHIFAHVSLSALSTGTTIDPVLARAGIDLLICNAAMAAVAAIDLNDSGQSDPGNTAANAAKSSHLRALGIRYLRLSAKSLPRPDALHALLYKM